MVTPPSVPIPQTSRPSPRMPLRILRTETVLSRFPIHNLTSHGRVSIHLRRTNAQGHHAQVSGLYGQLDKSAGFQYFVPWPNPRTDVLTFSTGYEDLRTSTSTSSPRSLAIRSCRYASASWASGA